MAATLLTLDVGNSAAKLRGWRVDGAGAVTCPWRADVAAAATDAQLLEELFARAGRFDAAAISSVAGEGLTDAWLERVARHSRERPLAALDAGLANRTREPARVGRDRLFAARGALECLGESALVVNAGTALTVDAVLAAAPAPGDGGWRSGAFLGGAIAPGPALQARALEAGAALLFEVEPEPDPPALGLDSAGAMRAGIGLGLRGAARELAREVARAAGLEDPPIALTGGARAFVRGAFEGRRLLEHAELVHVGLLAALLAHAGRPRPAALGAA